jgi:hypothetical protein
VPFQISIKLHPSKEPVPIAADSDLASAVKRPSETVASEMLLKDEHFKAAENLAVETISLVPVRKTVTELLVIVNVAGDVIETLERSSDKRED